MYLSITYIIIQYLIFYMSFSLLLEEEKTKTQKYSSIPSLSLVRISSSLEELGVNMLVNQNRIELAIKTEDLAFQNTFGHDESPEDSSSRESPQVTDNDSDEKQKAILGTKFASLSENEGFECACKPSESKTESQEIDQTEENKSYSTDRLDRQKLESELDALLKKEERLVKELKRTEYIAKIYSKEFLTDTNVRKTIECIEKYEQIKKSYEENRLLLEEKNGLRTLQVKTYTASCPKSL